MNTEGRKKNILNLLQKGTISIDEAIEMLEKCKETEEMENLHIFPAKKTYEEAVKEIVNDTLKEFDIDRVIDIMQKMDWQYASKGDSVNLTHSATAEEILDMAKYNIRTALNDLVKYHIEKNWTGAITSTGGFECHAWVDDDDWDNIQIELKFSPCIGYGSGHLDELVKLKVRQG